jgi:APA family basic amino acid/polyamine antiporter
MIGAGSAIGVSIFSVLSPAAKVAGDGLLTTLLIAAIPMGIFSLVYAFMVSADPKSGASYEWPRLYLSPALGFVVAWTNLLASAGLMILFAQVLVQYVAAYWALPQKATMFALFTAIYVVNVFGISLAARLQTVLMVLLLLSLALFVSVGAAGINWSHIGGFRPTDAVTVMSGVALLIGLFLGVEASTEIGEEVRDARKIVPKAIAIALLLVTVTYLAVAVVALGELGIAGLAASHAPLLDGSRTAIGGYASPLILFAAIASLLKSLNVTFVIFTRVLFAMGRNGALPASLGRIERKSGAPIVAASVAFLLTCVALVFPDDLVFLFLAVNVPFLLKYAATCACAIRVANGWADTYNRARFKPRRWVINLFSGLGIACSIVIIVAGSTADWRPYMLIVIWMIFGLTFKNINRVLARKS